MAAPLLDSHCDRPVTYPEDSKTLVKSLKGGSGPTLNMTAQLGLRTKIWERGNSHMECKWNHRENTGITNTTAEKENWHCDYNRKKKKNKRSEDIGNYIMIYSGVPANQWASSGVAI